MPLPTIRSLLEAFGRAVFAVSEQDFDGYQEASFMRVLVCHALQLPREHDQPHYVFVRTPTAARWWPRIATRS